MMTKLRTVVFVDGRNFKYNLQAFKFRASGYQRPFRLDEKHFQWREFFLGLMKRFDSATGHAHQLVRVYWYNADKIRPFEVKRRLVQKIKTDFQETFPDLGDDEIIKLAQNWYDAERHHFDQTRERVLEAIQRRVNFLEFRYIGEYVVRPFEPYRFLPNTDGSKFYLGTREGEKGVDVGIAVDMIAKLSNFDVAVLVSGDADFIPAVQYLKDNLKLVYQFSLATGIPPRINYLSPWLIGRVDCFQAFDELELLSSYLDRSSGIPPAVLECVDDRIKELEAIAQSQA